MQSRPDLGVPLPEGLTTRPLTRADSRAVYELMAAQEVEDIGEAFIEEADLICDWAKPSHDQSARSVAVFDGELMVAYAELAGADRADTAVLPAYRGRGIGTWLAAWLQDCGRRHGSSIVGMPVPVGSAGDRLLEALGFEVRWNSWVLQLPDGFEIQPRELPSGYTVGEAGEADRPAAHEVLEDAFLEWSERDREPWEDFAAQVMGRPGFEPWNIRVVKDAGGVVVGAAIVQLALPTAYIARLGVRKDQRGRGLAQALLVDAFALAREHGATVSELATDSRTGALPLYEKVGMVVTSSWVNRAIRL
ncbi:GNAT family N-acetyltransferase [Nocardioides gansuensis]|uniref:GNAT family N-acetyltransferase n=1 Tax=Nocardioides gansuensis TaxID=2138300 RepID=A0A2T8FGI1_9ACTN|nr:GNAT family N-acetyltransferase [Nocardioides gansuensis]PVG84822.1 GNAT family N-acetyltransferase [Nocardioides gansuensis]